jgi:excisionase family DNA binding protein
MLSIGRSLAYELIARGIIPSVRLGERRVLVPVAALQERIKDLAQSSR